MNPSSCSQDEFVSYQLPRFIPTPDEGLKVDTLSGAANQLYTEGQRLPARVDKRYAMFPGDRIQILGSERFDGWKPRPKEGATRSQQNDRRGPQKCGYSRTAPPDEPGKRRARVMPLSVAAEYREWLRDGHEFRAYQGWTRHVPLLKCKRRGPRRCATLSMSWQVFEPRSSGLTYTWLS